MKYVTFTKNLFCIKTHITFADEGQKGHDSLVILIFFQDRYKNQFSQVQKAAKKLSRDFLFCCFLKNNAIIKAVKMQLYKTFMSVKVFSVLKKDDALCTFFFFPSPCVLFIPESLNNSKVFSTKMIFHDIRYCP